MSALADGGRWQQYLVIVATSAQGAVLSSLVPPLLAERGYAVAAIGFLVAAQPVAALLSRLPGGLLYAPRRARWLLLVTLLATVVASLLHPLAASVPALVAVRLLAGAAYGLATTVNLALFTEQVPAGREGQQALGWYSACFAVGFSLGAFAAGFAADLIGAGPAFGVGAALGLVSLLGVPRGVPSAAGAARRPPPLRWRAALHPRLLAVLVICFLLFVQFSFWNAYLPLYALAIGLTLGEVGLIRGAFGLCQIVARPASGAVVGRIGPERLTAIGVVVQSAALFAVPLLAGFGPQLVLFLIMGTTRALAVVANSVELVASADQARVPRGVMSGLYNTAQDLGQLCGPALGGLLAASIGLSATFGAVAMLSLVGGSSVLLLAGWSARRT